VVLRSGDTSLAGTFIAPATPGPYPAVVLLHGSGPLTRHSFGPWPRFFNSLGMAVLVYDKRGTGASTGVRLDASTTVKIFQHASHSMMETPSRKGMAPGVFAYLRQWLLARVRLPHAGVTD
jgi:pimeloyl-ACP methyl ester carboxylesterase